MIYNGQPVEINTTFTANGAPADPTSVTLKVLGPSDTVPTEYVTPGGITHGGTGEYSKIITPNEPGRWSYQWIASGAVVAMDVGDFDVVDTPFGTGSRRPLWMPTITDVATLIRARTKDEYGNEIGTFTDSTRPTKTEVDRLIQVSANALISCAGDWLPAALQPFASHVIAVRTAMRVELAYWPEQIDENYSAYERLAAEWKEVKEQLCEAAGPFRPDDIPGGEENIIGTTLFYFGDGVEQGVTQFYVPDSQMTVATDTFYRVLFYGEY